MLAQARAKDPSLDLRQHDLAQPLPLADGSFDRVICCLVMDHVAGLRALFSELGRVCKPEGKIVVSIMHPAMMLRGIQARFRDPETGRETRPESVPNQIADYVTAALGAGLAIDHISEHAYDVESASRVPRAEKYIGWPMLLMLGLSRRSDGRGR
jgi:malonyl-CoA O-methyltransferase